MSANRLINAVGALAVVEMEIATSSSKTPEIETALRTAENAVGLAIVHMKQALTIKVKPEE